MPIVDWTVMPLWGYFTVLQYHHCHFSWKVKLPAASLVTSSSSIVLLSLGLCLVSPCQFVIAKATSQGSGDVQDETIDCRELAPDDNGHRQ